VAPESKKELLDSAEELAAKVEEQYEIGALTDDERRAELVKVWDAATDQVSAAMEQNFPEENSVLRLVNSGASGNWMQVRQLAGMRGLVTNPKGEIIPRPIKSNYREGLTVLEYFIASARRPQGPRGHRAAYR
jgi:DNA-directed RNA polymerase subunit beta'